MNSQARGMLKRIADGDIRDPDQVRGVLAVAREQLEKAEAARWKDGALLYAAEQAFLRGWPTDDEKREKAAEFRRKHV